MFKEKWEAFDGALVLWGAGKQELPGQNSDPSPALQIPGWMPGLDAGQEWYLICPQTLSAQKALSFAACQYWDQAGSWECLGVMPPQTLQTGRRLTVDVQPPQMQLPFSGACSVSSPARKET